MHRYNKLYTKFYTTQHTTRVTTQQLRQPYQQNKLSQKTRQQEKRTHPRLRDNPTPCTKSLYIRLYIRSNIQPSHKEHKQEYIYEPSKRRKLLPTNDNHANKLSPRLHHRHTTSPTMYKKYSTLFRSNDKPLRQYEHKPYNTITRRSFIRTRLIRRQPSVKYEHVPQHNGTNNHNHIYIVPEEDYGRGNVIGRGGTVT